MEKSDIYIRLSEARHNKQLLNELITEYIPFIRSCTKKQIFENGAVDDAMTVSMLTFARCINNYDKDRGDFFAFAEKVIRRSLIDDYRLNSKHNTNLSFDEVIDGNENSNIYENQVSIIQFETIQQQRDLQTEIEEFETTLEQNGMSIKKLMKICPKQKRSRELCQEIASTIINDDAIMKSYMKTNRIPRNEIAKKLNISPKTIEKHRKYLTVLLLILNGDYPLIRTFLPKITKGRWE